MDIIIILLLLAILALLIQQQKISTTSFRKSRIILDSCALIDGRILEIAKSGFISETIVIPKFILTELQYLADGSDAHKRERARFGLDMAHDLTEALPKQVIIDQTLFPSLNTTDDKLVVLAKKLKASLYTTDFNLNKVATVEGVKVLNVNELAQKLRPAILPGEERQVKVMQKGSNQNQGVGYLEDGTMVVIENGASHVGKVVSVIIAQMHQTVAGKMVFARLTQQYAKSEQPKVPTRHTRGRRDKQSNNTSIASRLRTNVISK